VRFVEEAVQAREPARFAECGQQVFAVAVQRLR
jgi:hypothetical protein